ncbi:MAG: cobalt-zinc-cadmium resistance protein CzcC [Limisphaerales bacterium]|nr:MAG: cobalt-zinc-cadmium resistance protein CzcC [Limisphaerales bacterium]KAG0509697.1 MAG: cobalt-zinc-cadmium resistance protein CzcC [Limisphaerales bacterium]TXT51184.1 MAG: cobalt-zinc-cadmium resistance protein CzcC [Limisphaerales bacterium]
MKTTAFLLASLLLVAAGTVHATALTNLTLTAALELAERQSPALAEARAQIAAAEGRLQQATRPPNPEAIARVESAPRDPAFLVGAAQSVPLGKRLTAAREVHEREREVLQHELAAKTRETRRRAHGAFATALFADEAHRLNTRLVDAATEAVRLARVRLVGGDVAADEVERAELELARARAELARATALRGQALAALSGTLGPSRPTVHSLAGALETGLELPALEAIVAELAVHPALAQAQAETAAARARVVLARAERVPDLTFELLFRRDEATRRNGFDVGFSLPLPMFNKGKGREQEARALQTAAEARTQRTQADLETDLRAAHGELAASLAHARQLQKEVVPRLARLASLVETRVSVGDATVADLIPLQRESAATHLARLESLRDAHQAWARLRPLLK